MIDFKRGQEGAALIVGLIMLVLLTLMAVTSFNLSKGNLQVVGNMQFRNEALRAAEEMVERAVSTPAALEASSAGDVDVNGDGVADVRVTVTPRLVQAFVKRNSQIVLSEPGQIGCSLGAVQSFGVAGAATGNSLCAAAVYDLAVVATQASTNAKVVLHQGVALQMPADKVCALVSCT